MSEAAGPIDVTMTIDGLRYHGTVATLAQLRTLMDRWKESGESLAGRYLWIAHLVIVRDLSIESVVAALEDLDRDGDLVHALEADLRLN